MRHLYASLFAVCLILIVGYGQTSLDFDDTKVYWLSSTVRLNETENGSIKFSSDIAYRVEGVVRIYRVWQHPSQKEKLFHLKISNLKTFTKSQDGNYEKRSMKLEDLQNGPFLLHWKENRILNIFVNSFEETVIKNLKKAVSSLFQFHLVDFVTEEMDICGHCSVKYEALDKTTILKEKEHCLSHLQSYEHPEKILGTNIKTTRHVIYQFNENGSFFIRAKAVESHELGLYVRSDVGVTVKAVLELNLTGKEAFKKKVMANSVENALEIIKNKFKYDVSKDSLYVMDESYLSNQKPLSYLIKEKYDSLRNDKLGTSDSATAFLDILNVAKNTPENDIVQVLNNKKNELILNQILDILGSAQTIDAHKAVLKSFNFGSPQNTDRLERYLWALSVTRNPKIEFIDDLKKLINRKTTNEKLFETLLLTLPVIVRRFSENETIQADTYSFLTTGFSKCNVDDDVCKSKYIRALRNFKYPKSKSFLLDLALTGSRIVSVTALKVLYSLPKSAWDKTVIKGAETIFYQKNKKYDSSARIIALDIILDYHPTEDVVRNLLKILLLDTPYEIKRYLLQKLNLIASTDLSFAKNLKSLMIEMNLNHYGVLAQKGLSNVMAIGIKSQDMEANLYTLNEISKGIIKRSHLSIHFQKQEHDMQICSFEMFSSGLSSFLWSDDTSTNEELDEPESLSAGIELGILDVQIRPFVFFAGHGELMGHIWSGTASERTTIFQAVTLLNDHVQSIALGTGNILKFELVGGTSYDLTGLLKFSLWNRNAHTFVEASVGAVLQGAVRMETSLVSNQIKFSISSEQMVELTSDLDFSDEVLACLQIAQTNSTSRYKVDKLQHIFNSNYNIRRRRNGELKVPGRSFAVNQKNNEMCNTILKRQAGVN